MNSCDGFVIFLTHEKPQNTNTFTDDFLLEKMTLLLNFFCHTFFSAQRKTLNLTN